ncbi:MAG: membrane dipeptidase [Calditrichaeota bacterium]|nr:MAG: membrane dipeptidase [Calditrichota bacterium]
MQRKLIGLFAISLVILFMLVNCTKSGEEKAEAMTTEEALTEARKLAREFILTDGHIDVPYRLREFMEDISVATKVGDFDYPRAKEGGLNVPFMSIYIPAKYQEKGGGKAVADSLIDLVVGFTQKYPAKFALATSVADVLEQFKRGVISLAMGMENGAGIEDDLKNLEYFYQRGIRYITLTHSKNNLICDSSYDKERRWNGLSPFGEKVVQEMNRLGIMVDISHVSDSTFYDVLRISKAPVIASHSSCRYFTPEWERNMSDEMIKALAEKGGVININFGSAFLRKEYQGSWAKAMQEIEEHLNANNIPKGSEEAALYYQQYRMEHRKGTVADVADHIDHVVQLVGVDHVGLGSDFDGVLALPKGLEDVSKYPNLIAELLKRGYSEADIEKICGGNMLRVWAEVERVAKELQGKEMP